MVKPFLATERQTPPCDFSLGELPPVDAETHNTRNCREAGKVHRRHMEQVTGGVRPLSEE